jgi:hypothetical protein
MRPEKAIIMFYPNGADFEMGQTAVIAGSQYFSVDRGANWVHSEDRLQRLFVPPLSQPEMRAALEEHYAFRAGSVSDLAERDRILGADLALLGDSERATERFLTVPPGSVAIIHFDLFHRGARAAAADPWRPMFKFSASRVSAPAAETAATPVDPEAARPAFSSVCAEHVWRYLLYSQLCIGTLYSVLLTAADDEYLSGPLLSFVLEFSIEFC